jgi:hypothetical protein
LGATAAVKGFGQVFERKIVNADDYRTGRKRGTSELDMQHVYGMAAQFRA